MICKEFDLISEYYDGELDEAAQKHMEEHLASCAACAKELERYSQLSEVFSQCAQLEPTAEFQTALSQKLSAVAAIQHSSKKTWKEATKAWLVNWRVTGSFAAACLVFFLVMAASNGGFVKYAPPKPSDSMVDSGKGVQSGKESILMDQETAKQPNQSPQSTDAAPAQKQQSNQAGSVAYNFGTVPLQQEKGATVADAGSESGAISPQPTDAARMVQEPADLVELLDAPTLDNERGTSAQPSLEMAAIPSATPMPAATGVPKLASADTTLMQSPPPAALPEATIAASPIEHTALAAPTPAPAADRAGAGVGGSSASMKGYNFYVKQITRFQVTDLDVAAEVLRRYGMLIETASGKKVYEIANERFEEAYQALAGLTGANSLGVESIDYTAQYNSLNIQMQDVVTNNGDGSAFAKKIAVIENLSNVQYIEITL